MEKYLKYLVYQKNLLRQLGIVGLKAAHLEAAPIKNKKILDQMARKFGDHHLLGNVERTLAQFMCQESLYSHGLQKWISRGLFLILIPVVILLILKNSLRREAAQSCDVFIFEYGDLDYVRADFSGKMFCSGAAGVGVGQYMGVSEWTFLLKAILRRPAILLFPKLIINILRWLSAYAWVVRFRSPRVVATFFEGTASSSLLTEYLHQKNIQHFNYAHGEHFQFDCYSAYANFDRYTIWGDHFKSIQIEKHCREEMFVTRAPDLFKKFYAEKDQLKKSAHQLTVLIHSGVEKGQVEYDHLLSLVSKLEPSWSLRLRPHPVDRASWPQVRSDLQADLRALGKNLTIESELPEEMSMAESVQQSRFFVGSASAALLEALLSGSKIIYLTGRVRNPDVLYRHGGSQNVFAYRPDIEDSHIQKFLKEAYVRNDFEEGRIRYLFDLGEK